MILAATTSPAPPFPHTIARVPARRRPAAPPLRDLYIHTAAFAGLLWLGMWSAAVVWLGTITVVAPLLAIRRRTHGLPRPTTDRSPPQSAVRFGAT